MPAVSIRAQSAPCQRVTYEHSEYTVCEVDLRRQSVRLFWKKPDGHAYGYPSSLPRTLGNHSGRALSRQMVAFSSLTLTKAFCLALVWLTILNRARSIDQGKTAR